MLLNTIGETVTRLLNLAVKQCDGSWLTQLLLMLRSHIVILRTLCAVICHLPVSYTHLTLPTNREV